MGSLDTNLYILHGWTTSIEKWKPFLSTLENTGITPVFLKIPGLTTPITKPWTISDYVKWLDKEIPAGKRVSLLGHSNGGRIILSFALKYPERVEQLFLVDSAGIYHNDFYTKTKRGLFKVASVIGKSVTSSEKARKLFYKVVRERDYQEATPLMRETMKNLISVDLAPQLQKIKVPVTIIWGKNDLTTPFTDAMAMVNELPNSKLFPIENASHSPQFTHTQEVVDIVRKKFK